MKIKISDKVDVDYSITMNGSQTVYSVNKVINNGENQNTDKEFKNLEELEEYYKNYDWRH